MILIQDKRPICKVLAVFFFAITLVGCAVKTATPDKPRTTVSAFSSVKPDGPLPVGWGLRPLSRFKKDTSYRLISDASGLTVIEAQANQSASGLVKSLDIDPTLMPWIHWRWRVPSLIVGADNKRRDLEDAPVRVIVTFDGDMSKLDFEENAVAARVKALTGQALPYATLMYIWENKASIDEVIESPHTSRIKMIVAESGDMQREKWVNYERNIVRDYEKAFGEKPGRIRSLGIMTDTDNTGEQTIAFYGDIRFSPKPDKKEKE
jgi:hypothetical protein